MIEKMKKTYAAPAAAKRAGSVNGRGGTKGMAKAQTDIDRVKALKAEITRLKAMVNSRPKVPKSASRAKAVNARGGAAGTGGPKKLRDAQRATNIAKTKKAPAQALRAGSVNGRGGTKGMTKAANAMGMSKFRKSERTTKSAGTRRYGSM